MSLSMPSPTTAPQFCVPQCASRARKASPTVSEWRISKPNHPSEARVARWPTSSPDEDSSSARLRGRSGGRG